MENNFCSRCGNPLDENQKFCEVCGVKIPRPSIFAKFMRFFNTKKRRIIGIVGLVIFVEIIIGIILFIALGLNGDKNSIFSKNGLVRNIEWGTDMNTVYNTVSKVNSTAQLQDEAQTVTEKITNFEGVEDLDVSVLYLFENNKLTKAGATLETTDKYDIEKLYSIFKNKFLAKYGKPAEINEDDNSIFNLNLDNSIWYINNTKISVSMWSDTELIIQFSKN